VRKGRNEKPRSEHVKFEMLYKCFCVLTMFGMWKGEQRELGDEIFDDFESKF
jgi:hypothetical protein